MLAPTILLVDRTIRTRDWRIDPSRLHDALQRYVDDELGPVWGVACDLRLATEPPPGAWTMVFVDDSRPGTLGFHDLSPEGVPQATIGVGTILAQNRAVSVTASHELAEMLVDPALNSIALGPRGALYAREVCDPVEGEQFLVGDVAVASFVFPAWFDGQGAARYRDPQGRFDRLGHLRGPFELGPNGYIPVLQMGKWQKISASERPKAIFSAPARPPTRPPSRMRAPGLRRR